MQIKVLACADCFSINTSGVVGTQLEFARIREISEGFRHWRRYDFSPRECSYVDFLNESVCGICHRSLTSDRRQRDDGNPVRERRVLPNGDRRTPFSRGCRVLMASLRAA